MAAEVLCKTRLRLGIAGVPHYRTVQVKWLLVTLVDGGGVDGGLCGYIVLDYFNVLILIITICNRYKHMNHI